MTEKPPFEMGDVRPIHLSPTHVRSGRLIARDDEDDMILVQFDDYDSRWVRDDQIG